MPGGFERLDVETGDGARDADRRTWWRTVVEMFSGIDFVVSAPEEATTCHLFDGRHPELEAAMNRRAEGRWKLLGALLFSATFMAIEMIAAYISNSLALWSDSVHMLSDVTGFAVALVAQSYASKTPSSTHSFGYLRAEVLGALASVMLVWGVTGILVWEAVGRMLHPQEVNGKMMVIVGCLGLASNVFIALVLHGHGHHHHGHGHGHGHSHGHGHGHGHSRHGHSHGHGHGHGHSRHGRSHNDDHDHDHDDHHDHDHDHDHSHSDSDTESHSHSPSDNSSHDAHGHSHGHGHHDSVNQRAALLHAIGDGIQNIGVIIAGLLIWIRPGGYSFWTYADPACTFLFSVLVLLTTSGILRELSDVLMERAPRDQQACDLHLDLARVPGVAQVHDLHLWQLSAGVPLFSCHVVLAPGADWREVLSSCEKVAHRRGLKHSTIQVEDSPGSSVCRMPMP